MALSKSQRIELLEGEVADLRVNVGRIPALLDKIEELENDLRANEIQHAENMDAMRAEIDDLASRVTLMARAMANNPDGGGGRAKKAKIPEPRPFGGARSAREVENFLFDMEQYFRTAKVEDEDEMINTTVSYFTDDAKQWWRCKHHDISEGPNQINSWEDMRKAIKASFYPENTAYNARKALKSLTQTGSIRDYVKEFSALMLDITGMAEEDKLFFFMEGLKPWARTELNRRQVQSLAAAITAAECLIDYAELPKKDTPTSTPTRSGENNKPRAGFRAGGQDGQSRFGNGAKPAESGQSSSGSNNRGNGGVKSGPCFWCQGPHQVRDCPEKQTLNALAEKLGTISFSEGSSKSSEAVNSEGDEDVIGAFTHFCNAVSLDLKPIDKGKAPMKCHSGPATRAKPLDAKLMPKRRNGKGLMYVDVKLNGKPIRAMVDTGATHNYLASTEVQRLGLVLEKGTGRVKAINSPAKPVAGIARGVHIRAGPYEGKTCFSVVEMDDFKVILGLEFLRETKANVMPATDSLMLLGDKPCSIPVVAQNTNGGFLSTFQSRKGHRRRASRSVAVSKGDGVEAISDPLSPKNAPPRRKVDHGREPMTGAKILTHAPSRKSQPELATLKKQLSELSEEEYKLCTKHRARCTNVVVYALSQKAEFQDSQLNAILMGNSQVTTSINDRRKNVAVNEAKVQDAMVVRRYGGPEEPSRSKIHRAPLPTQVNKRVPKAIIDDRWVTASGVRCLELLVKWKDSPKEESTWESRETWKSWPKLVGSYLSKDVAEGDNNSSGGECHGPLHG